jgi:exodeoxyribonuclease V beta subunit
MESHDYPMQALLYSVALHRFLSMRLPGYDPDVHHAGSGYLFVRGMTGAETPVINGQVRGLSAWRPSTEVLRRLDALFAGKELVV